MKRSILIGGIVGVAVLVALLFFLVPRAPESNDEIEWGMAEEVFDQEMVFDIDRFTSGEIDCTHLENEKERPRCEEAKFVQAALRMRDITQCDQASNVPRCQVEVSSMAAQSGDPKTWCSFLPEKMRHECLAFAVNQQVIKAGDIEQCKKVDSNFIHSCVSNMFSAWFAEGRDVQCELYPEYEMLCSNLMLLDKAFRAIDTSMCSDISDPTLVKQCENILNELTRSTF
jgi:hypothetical protein